VSSNRLIGVLLLMIVAFLVAACGSGENTRLPLTDAHEEPIRILFIGDSFSVAMGPLTEHLAATGESPVILEATELTSLGTSLGGLWISRRTVPTIQDGDWTVVVLQADLAVEDADVESFYERTRNFDAEIKDAGAAALLFMPWKCDNSNPVRIEHIAAPFSKMGADLGIKVAPVGLAWNRSTIERPNLDLYSGDRVHSSILGAYLTASVLYATIFDQTPAGIPFWPTNVDNISDDDLAFLQRTAWQTVIDYGDSNN
jgi:hypothetical protein